MMCDHLRGLAPVPKHARIMASGLALRERQVSTDLALAVLGSFALAVQKSLGPCRATVGGQGRSGQGSQQCGAQRRTALFPGPHLGHICEHPYSK